MRLNLRRWLIVILGAGLPIPYALHLRGDSSNYVAVDLLLWPIVAGTLVITSREKWWLLYRDAVGVLLLTFVVISALTVPVGYLVYHSSSGALSFAYELLILSNFVVGFAALKRDQDLELLVRSFVISLGTIASVLSIYLLLVGEIGRVHVIHNSPALRALIYGWPNGFAVLLVVGLVMAVYLVSKSTTHAERIFYGALVGGLGLCVLLTVSKTGWVAAVLAAWLLWIRFWRPERQLALIGVIAIAAVSLLLVGNASVRQQIFTLDTLNERLQFLLLVIRDVNPLVLLFGSGSQNVETVMAAHAREILIPHVTVGSLSTHDEFLSTVIKSGIIGLIVYVAALGAVMWRAWRLSGAGDPSTSRMFRFWFAAAAGVMVSLVAGEELRYWLVSAMFWLMAGAAAQRVAAGAIVDLRPGDELKRVLDVVAATIGLIVLSPVIAIAALAVRLDSPGPVVYAGERVGLNGRVFRMFKLRTMRTGADAQGSVTVARDPRITRVGRVLRRLKIDELPQLANVVIGDMSIVGPRPDTPEYVRLYDQRQRGLLKVRPGITSPASVQFHDEEELLRAAAQNGRTSADVYRDVIMPKEIEIDLEYVEHRSFRTDLGVVLQTAGLVLRRIAPSSGKAGHAHRGSQPAPQPEVDETL